VTEHTPATPEVAVAAPRDDERAAFDRWLGIGTEFLLRHRRTVLVVGLFSAIASVAYAVWGLGFRTSRLDLLNRNSEYNQRWLAYLDEFGSDDDVLVIVAGANPTAIEPVLDALHGELSARQEHFHSVLCRSDLSRLSGKGLHFIPAADLRRLAMFVERLEPLARGDFSALTTAGPAAIGDEDSRRAAISLLRSLAQALGARQQGNAEFGAELDVLGERFAEFRSRPLIDGGGQLGLCALRFTSRSDELVPHGESIKQLRRLVADLQTRFPNVRLGVTGMPILEFDEMASSQRDMTLASILSVVLVLLLLMLGYGNLRFALIAGAVLLVGMAWTFGFITLAIGHLNLLSVSFAAILVGLGIDFSIHFLARFADLRGQGLAPVAAFASTASQAGRVVTTGAVTTAAAFFSAGLTDFTGIAELGVIAGGGILICLAAAFLILPPLALEVEERWPLPPTRGAVGIAPLLDRLANRPWTVIAAIVALSATVLPGAAWVFYDHNLLNLQPKRLASVEWEHVLLQRSDRSVWFAVSMADSPEQLRTLKERFELLPSVERTEEILSLMPASVPESQRLITALRDRLAALPTAVPLLPAVAPADLHQEMGRLLGEGSGQRGAAIPSSPGGLPPGGLPPGGLPPGMDPELAMLLGEIKRQVGTMEPAELSRRLSRWRQELAESVLARLRGLTRFADPVPPTASDLDQALVARFIGNRGKHLLRVYAKGDIWEREALERFVREVERVDRRITGHPIQTYYASGQMQRSYLHAGVYALLAVAMLLMFDFSSLRATAVAMVPLIMGFALLVGVMGWLRIPFNAANTIILPLLLGIGIDNGVHVVHDWRSQPVGAYRMRSSMAVAMLLCSATTMAGFCSMIFARHQGLRTLGQVLTLGIACCLATSLVFLPAVLTIVDRWRRSRLERRANAAFHPGG
jgi:hopanoid biosynthesis associated RND transporter like protein HpnN